MAAAAAIINTRKGKSALVEMDTQNNPLPSVAWSLGCRFLLEGWRAKTGGLWRGAQKAGGGSVGLSGCLFWLCVWGPPTQHMRLPGQKLHFLGNPQTSASDLCTKTHRHLLPGDGQRKIPLGFLLLRGQLFLFGLRWFQRVCVGLCTPGKELVSVKERPKCFPPLHGRSVSLLFLDS